MKGFHGKVGRCLIKAVIVSLYKEKGSKSDCKNYRGISLLSIIGKVYAKIVTDHVNRISKPHAVEGGFRKETGCLDQIFTPTQVVEEVLEKKMYAAFMDLEKAFVTFIS